jgi:YegS/Rv2252/BmrU family lipid kinase
MRVEQRESTDGAPVIDPITRAVAIINPVSGAGLDPAAAKRRVALVRDTLARAGLAASIHLTERAGHARDLAAAAVQDGADLVIVWGGDGTVNEAGAALAGTATAIGLVPAGSGNGLAAALGSPRDPHAALRRILSSARRAVDVGMLAGRPFLNIAGIGFDAHIAAEFNRRGRGRRGRLPYVVIGVREGCRYRGLPYDIELDGEPFHLDALLIAFANGREYGMGACIAPGARLDDGLLEATIVEDRPVVSRFLHARHLARQAIARAPRIVIRQVKAAIIKSEHLMQYHVDGEPGTAEGQIEVGILPGTLWVRG